jgi:hypothetical protein
MAKDETKRNSPAILKADKNGFTNLEGMIDYKPANEAYTYEKVKAAYDLILSKQALEVKATEAMNVARDIANSAEWAFHYMMLGIKKQVAAKYGENSSQLESLGLKKKTYYKKPSGRKPKA